MNVPHAQRIRGSNLRCSAFSPQASRKVNPYYDIFNRYVSPYDPFQYVLYLPSISPHVPPVTTCSRPHPSGFRSTPPVLFSDSFPFYTVCMVGLLLYGSQICYRRHRRQLNDGSLRANFTTAAILNACPKECTGMREKL
jgi:hypothetical protein